MGLGPGGEDPRLLNWAARGGRRLLRLRMQPLTAQAASGLSALQV